MTETEREESGIFIRSTYSVICEAARAGQMRERAREEEERQRGETEWSGAMGLRPTLNRAGGVADDDRPDRGGPDGPRDSTGCGPA